MNTHPPARLPAAIVTSNPTHGVHRCKACQCLIIWRYHEKTRRLAPIDVTPQPGGNVALVGPDEDPTGETYRIVKADGSRRYVNHFVTCKDKQLFGGGR